MTDLARACADLARTAWRASPARLVGALLLLIGQAVALPLAAPALGALTDAVLEDDARAALVSAALVAVLAIAALTFAHFAHIAYFELGELNALTRDRELIDLANGSVGLDHHERPDYADRLQVVRQELDRTSAQSLEALLQTVSTAIALSVTTVLLAGIDPWMLLLPLAGLPPLVTGHLAESAASRAREDASAATRLAAHLFDLSSDGSSAKELQVTGVGPVLTARYARLWADATRARWRGEVRAAAWRVAGQLVFAGAYVAVTLAVVRDAVQGRSTVGDVVLVVVLAAQVNQQVVAAVAVAQRLQRVARTLAGVRWLREVTRAPVPAVVADVPARLTQGITFRGVSFRYPGTLPDVLTDVDLQIPAASTVAVIGENGAGKSTLVKLLCRFYEPTQGAIEIDGVDLATLDATAWRARCAAGFQDFARFELLAREVVGVGDLPRIDDSDAVLGALDRAQARGLVGALPDGLDTPLGLSLPGGRLLSGGQWQKLALGRAMMRETPLLVVLDEPTAALDASAEHELFAQYAAGARRVAARTGGITVLVSHRFSTVQTADLVVVVGDSGVLEVGTHAELMASGGTYHRLYSLQAAQYER